MSCPSCGGRGGFSMLRWTYVKREGKATWNGRCAGCAQPLTMIAPKGFIAAFNLIALLVIAMVIAAAAFVFACSGPECIEARMGRAIGGGLGLLVGFLVIAGGMRVLRSRGELALQAPRNPPWRRAHPASTGLIGGRADSGRSQRHT